MRVFRIHGSVFVASAILVVASLVVHAQTTQPSSATGTWQWSYEGFGGNQVDVTLKLKQDGDKLTGTITGFQGQEMEIRDGSIKEGKIIFKVVREIGGQTSTTTYTGTLSGNSFKGKSETVSTREFDAKRSAS
jgi:hypothetical protein